MGFRRATRGQPSEPTTEMTVWNSYVTHSLLDTGPLYSTAEEYYSNIIMIVSLQYSTGIR